MSSAEMEPTLQLGVARRYPRCGQICAPALELKICYPKTADAVLEDKGPYVSHPIKPHHSLTAGHSPHQIEGRMVNSYRMTVEADADTEGRMRIRNRWSQGKGRLSHSMQQL